MEPPSPPTGEPPFGPAPRTTRRDRAAALALARRMVGECADIDPVDVRFQLTPGGRPEVSDPPAARGVRFSGSHSDGVALCATARGLAIGADVESLRNLGDDPLSVASVVCSADDAEALRRVPADERARRVLAMWTLKEAASKALGYGFRLPLEHVRVTGNGKGLPRVRFDAILEEDPSLWRFGVADVPPHHLAAVAVRWPGGNAAAPRAADEVCQGVRVRVVRTDGGPPWLLQGALSPLPLRWFAPDRGDVERWPASGDGNGAAS